MPTVRPSRLPIGWVLGAIGLAGAAAVVGTVIGPASLSVGEIGSALAERWFGIGAGAELSAAQEAILFEIRLPRVALGMLVGGGLAVSGAAYQGVFRNPLADPFLLGVAAGAGLGATITIVFGFDRALVPPLAFLGAIVGVAGAYGLGYSLRTGRSTGSLLLAGVAIAAFLTAVQTYLQQLNAETLRDVYTWILGRLATTGWNEVVLVIPYVVVGCVVLLAHRLVLDVLALGDEEATALGVRVNRVRAVVIGAATLVTAAAVAVSGLIAFVGIIVPHILRLIVGTSYRRLIPLSIIVGGSFLALADIIARSVQEPAELPIGVVTAFIGAPFFALVLRTTSRAA